MNEIKKLSWANMDIDLNSQNDINWEQDKCPRNLDEWVNIYKCAIKNISVCDYFCGIDYIDTVLCSYPNKNPFDE